MTVPWEREIGIQDIEEPARSSHRKSLIDYGGIRILESKHRAMALLTDRGTHNLKPIIAIYIASDSGSEEHCRESACQGIQ